MRVLPPTGLRARLYWGFLVFLLLAAWSPPVWAQSPTIVHVEEDWEMVVTNPDADSNAPQVTCIMSPTGNIYSVHAALQLNHSTMPSYTPGGLQLQVWYGNWPWQERRFVSSAVLAQPSETITWTQTMDLVGSILTVEVINGSSTTWGAFGAEGSLRLHGLTELSDLNGYTPAVSVSNSAIGYAANRVQSLVLKKVRLTTSTGEVIEDTTPRPVHQED